jgi:hypothetical protein
MKKSTTGPQKIRLSRETLLRLTSEQLVQPRGGVATYGKACEPTSNCTQSLNCTITACGHC